MQALCVANWFLPPYLTAVLNTMGLVDITFFSVEGTARGGDKLAYARSKAHGFVAEHFHPLHAMVCLEQP